MRYTDALREHGGPPIRGAQISPLEVRVAAEVNAGWQRRCVRGVREWGSPATVEILPEGVRRRLISLNSGGPYA